MNFDRIVDLQRDASELALAKLFNGFKMVSSNQTATVKRLEAEGWTIVQPAPTELRLGGPIVMQRAAGAPGTMARPGAPIDRIAVIPDGTLTDVKQPP